MTPDASRCADLRARIPACRIAAERKRCGYETEAWEQFTALELRAATDPAVADWIERNADQFRWGTKQYDAVAALLADRYAKSPTSSLAWERYRALARGGNWAGAAAQLVEGKKAHPGSRFSSTREELARAQLLAGDYAAARESFSALAKGGGAFGKEAKDYLLKRGISEVPTRSHHQRRRLDRRCRALLPGSYARTHQPSDRGETRPG